MAWRRAFRWLLWSGVAAVGLLAAAALSSPLWLRPLAERQASAVLGRPVAIGRLHLRPGDPLVLAAEDVVVGNPPGFPAGEHEPFARVPRFDGASGRLGVPAPARGRHPFGRGGTARAARRLQPRTGATTTASAPPPARQAEGPARRSGRSRSRTDARAFPCATLRADFEVAFAIEEEAEQDGAPGHRGRGPGHLRRRAGRSAVQGRGAAHAARPFPALAGRAAPDQRADAWPR